MAPLRALRVLRGELFGLPFAFAFTFCLHAEILFHSNFESERMYSAEALKPGAKKIELLPSPEIEKWFPANGGEAIIEFDYPPNREVIQYAKREDMVLLGVKGIRKDHAKWVSIKSGTLAEWYQDKRQIQLFTKGHIQLDSQKPLEGAFSARVIGNTDSTTILSAAIPKAGGKSFYSRFRVRLSSDFVLNRSIPCPIFYARIGRIVSPKIALVAAEKGIEVSATAGPSEKLLHKEINARTRILPDEDCEIAMAIEKTAGNRSITQLWVNGLYQSASEFAHEPYEREEHGIAMGKTGNFPFGGTIWFDKLTVSDSVVGTYPPQAKLEFQDTKLICDFAKKRDSNSKIVAAQWQISPDNSWLLHAFNSGRDGVHVFELPHPHYVVMPESIPPTKARFDSVRVPLPLSPGQTCFARVRHQASTGNWGPWSTPCAFQLPLSPGKTRPNMPRVTNAWFTLPSKTEMRNELKKGNWADLHFRFSPTSRNSYLQIYLSGNPESNLQNYRNLGNAFTSRDNYAVNLSFLHKGVWVKQDEGSNHLTLLLGKTGRYCDDSEGISKLNWQKGEACVRVRLLENATTGPWKIKAFLCDNARDASPFLEKLFIVKDQSNTTGEPGSTRSPILFLIAAGLLIGFVAFAVIRRRYGVASQSNPADPVQGQNEHVRAAVQFIQENFQKPISLNDVAQAINLSPDWLGSLFKEETGESVLHFINKLRVEKAEDLLRNTQLRMSEIAFQVGFNSVVNFNKTFKRISGTPPSSFR